jgi:WD40-like Beta Propeller Repeat
MDIHEFDKNRAAYPPEDLQQYRGQYIAWSPDGTRIIASDQDGRKLDDTVRALGYDPAQIVFSFVPDEEELYIEDTRISHTPRRAAAILDMSQFIKNQHAFPPEDLLQYRGQYIAWSPDGSQVIASDKDFLKLDDTVQALGYDPSQTLISTVPDVDIILGAGAMGE